MKNVATPWDKLYKPLFLLGVFLTVIGLIFMYVTRGNLAILINGALWLTIGFGLKIKENYNQRKLESLKRDSLSYECSVINIIPAYSIRIGSYITARVECVYETESRSHSIKSGYYLLSPLDRIEDLYAKIYFNYNNLDEYIIELFRKDNRIVHK